MPAAPIPIAQLTSCRDLDRQVCTCRSPGDRWRRDRHGGDPRPAQRTLHVPRYERLWHTASGATDCPQVRCPARAAGRDLMTVPASWPSLYVPVCPLHEVAVPLGHVPEHTWLSLSDDEWAVNLSMYATQPERFLQIQCEGECWCNPPDAQANSWAGHGRGPAACPFEARPFDEEFARAFVTARQSQAAGQPLPPLAPRLMLDVVAALAHQPGWCECLPSMLTRLDQAADYIARKWSLDTFPGVESGVVVARDWVDTLGHSREWLFISGAVGRGKTGLSASVAQRFLAADPQRTAFLGRVSPVRDELAGEHGAILARWLESVGLLVLDDLDFGWSSTPSVDRGGLLLARALTARLAAPGPVLMTAHVPLKTLSEPVDPEVRKMLATANWRIVALNNGPSLRTGRLW